MQRMAAAAAASAVMPNSRYTVSAKAGHSDEFAAVAEPARPVALDRGFNSHARSMSQNLGPVLIRLGAEQIEAWRRNHRGADVVRRKQSGRVESDRDFRARRDQCHVTSAVGLNDHIGAKRDQIRMARGLTERPQRL